MLPRLILTLSFAALLAHAQLPFPVAAVDDIRHLGMDMDDREYADLGRARAFPEDDEMLRIEGLDARGLPWRVWLPRVWGVGGFTEVFRADLDGNGHSDLLFAAQFMGNGRCVDSGTVTTLLFGADGRPMPWQAHTHAFDFRSPTPVPFVDLNSDGRAELITSTCEYAFREDRSIAEDRWITGIYEARSGRWIPMQPQAIDPYLGAVQSRFTEFEPGYIEWKPAAEEWPDLVAGLDSRKTVEISALLTGGIGCGGALGPLGLGEETPCSASAFGGLVRYSDGKVRRGWPPVVIDAPAGREIHIADSRTALETALAQKLSVRVLGPDAEPSFLWIDSHAVSSPAARITLRLAVTHVTTATIDASGKADESTPAEGPHFDTSRLGIVGVAPEPSGKDKPQGATDTATYASFLLGLPAGSPLPTLSAPRGTFFTRERACFELPAGSAPYQRVRPLGDCKDLGFLEAAAAQGERVFMAPFDLPYQRLSPRERTLRWVLNLPRGGEHVSREIEFEPPPGVTGDLVGVVEFSPGWLAQWSLAGDSWFSLHADTGQPMSRAFRVNVEGELFQLDRSRGLVFLRWTQGIPTEVSLVSAALEWGCEE